MNEFNFSIAATVLGVLAFCASIVSLVLTGKLRRLKKIFGDDNQPDNLEEVITSITDALRKMKTDHNQLAELVNHQGQVLETAFQFSHVVRFDSGGSDGGNLSFAMALLDGHQSGLIITSLHGREHNRIYCKAVIEGTSQNQLSDEEQEALIGALTRNGESKIPKPKSKQAIK